MPRLVNGRLINEARIDEPWDDMEVDNITEIYNFLPDYGERITNRHHHDRLYEHSNINVAVYCDGNSRTGINRAAGIVGILDVNQDSTTSGRMPLYLRQAQIESSITDFDTNTLGAGDVTFSTSYDASGIFGAMMIRLKDATNTWTKYRVRVYGNA